MQKFTDIGQFREVIREVKTNYDYRGDDGDGNPIYAHDTIYPTLTFRGTVKSHGSNAAIVKHKTKGSPLQEYYTFQSRENELAIGKDNAAFMATMLTKSYKELFDGIDFNESCVIYGEWAGIGIQKGVAIAQLERFFMVFALKIDGVYHDLINYKFIKNEDERIFNILDFPTYTIDIDFNNPLLVQNKLIELTMAVEAECPVGKQFGVSSTGEGIVWESFNEHMKKRYIFKVKGDKHAGKSKTITLKPVDDEKINKCMEIAETVTPSWRLSQMIEQTFNTANGGIIDRKRLGDYIKLVIADVIKEDSDIIKDANLELKDIAKYISNIAKQYFFDVEKDL